jgi:poly-gamma-glutamate synthesis protein (capsule biosynthesis protein)
MNKYFLIILSFLFTTLHAQYYYTISDITKNIENRMVAGNSYKDGCPVELKDLKYLTLSYIDFENKNKIGELIVHKDISKEIIEIFEKLYNINYPIYKMKLVSDFKANDFKSIEENNTSAFNCRNIANTSRWSNHAYGRAIDINPIQNPYISKDGKIFHNDSNKHRKREHTNLLNSQDKARLLKNDKAVKIFKRYGFIWGGNWKSIKDYQHFDKRK